MNSNDVKEQALADAYSSGKQVSVEGYSAFCRFKLHGSAVGHLKAKMVRSARKCLQFRMLIPSRNNSYTDSKLQIQVYLQLNKFLTP